MGMMAENSAFYLPRSSRFNRANGNMYSYITLNKTSTITPPCALPNRRLSIRSLCEKEAATMSEPLPGWRHHHPFLDLLHLAWR